MTSMTETTPAASPRVRFNCFSVSPSHSWVLIDVHCVPQDGHLHHLTLDVSISNGGTQYLTTLGQLERPSLAVGDVWTVGVLLCMAKSTLRSKMSIPFLRGRATSQSITDSLQSMLKVYTRNSSRNAIPIIANMKLSFRHSLLPDNIQLSFKTNCGCLEAMRLGAFRETQTEMRYESGLLLRTHALLRTDRSSQSSQTSSRLDGPVPETELEKLTRMAESVIRLLQEDLSMTTALLDPKPRNISTIDALSLLDDLNGAAGKELPQLAATEIELLRSLYGTILEGEKAQALRRTRNANSRRKYSNSSKSLCYTRDVFDSLPGPPIIRLNNPSTENRRNAMELDRDSYDFGPVLRDMTNRESRGGTKQTNQQPQTRRTIRYRPDDPDVPAPLFSPRKAKAKAKPAAKPNSKVPSTHGYGALQKQGSWSRYYQRSPVSMRKIGEASKGYTVEDWTQKPLEQEFEGETEQDPARIIWEKMRVSSDGSGFSDEDEERLQELNLTSAPWM